MNLARIKFQIFFLVCVLHLIGLSQTNYKIETTDIDNFWMAYDKLSGLSSKKDSIETIQINYINKATKNFKKFIRNKKLTAVNYVSVISQCPKFWKSIRPLTEKIKTQKEDINLLFKKFKENFPHFNTPDICFFIGCLNTGGTTSKNLLLIGAEIGVADSTIDKSELNSWLKSILGKPNPLFSYIAHETVHTQQHGIPFRELPKLFKHRSLTLLNMAILEGSADFLTVKFFGLNINPHILSYGNKYECSLWKEFEKSITNQPFYLYDWLYNGRAAKNRPADLGYYIGYKITESYYEKKNDKRKALKILLHRGKYKKVYQQSEYWKNCS